MPPRTQAMSRDLFSCPSWVVVNNATSLQLAEIRYLAKHCIMHNRHARNDPAPNVPSASQPKTDSKMRVKSTPMQHMSVKK